MNLLRLINGEPAFYCPGCMTAHRLPVQKADSPEVGVWDFNWDLEKPSFSPSLNIPGRCHLFVRDGILNYCTDSKHELAGMAVNMVPFPEIPQLELNTDKHDAMRFRWLEKHGIQILRGESVTWTMEDGSTFTSNFTLSNRNTQFSPAETLGKCIDEAMLSGRV